MVLLIWGPSDQLFEPVDDLVDDPGRAPRLRVFFHPGMHCGVAEILTQPEPRPWCLTAFLHFRVIGQGAVPLQGNEPAADLAQRRFHWQLRPPQIR
ncbi:hypothetical protein GCM10011359_13130 [Nesterenkonia alkaliphila]|nr:hypothetical protein GCM10011359_13130 [Nesterenkonia alkaliphila]